MSTSCTLFRIEPVKWGKIFAILIMMCSSVWCLEEQEIEMHVVRILQGHVQGAAVTSPDGQKFYAFRGIPYAKPPIKELRFQPPEEVEIWNDTLRTVDDGPVCVQMDTTRMVPIGQEDCLVLNVYTPQLPSLKSGSKLAVMVYFHGGVFEIGTGSSQFYGPLRLMKAGGVILVTVNYRLGPFGFLSTGDTFAKGNYGLLDQVLSLKWVQQNIVTFGGDSKQVTIFGQDAGAASVLYHVLSPLSAGLFHRVIAQSGSPLCSTSFQKEPLKAAQELARRLNCDSEISEKLVSCLRERPAEDLTGAAFSMHAISYFPLPFLPVVGRNDGDFLPDTPINLLKEKKINKAPVILGFTKDEGSLLFHDLRRSFPEKGIKFFADAFPLILSLTTDYSGNFKSVSSAAEKVYFKGLNIDDEGEFNKTVIEIFSDYIFRSCIVETAKYLSEVGWPTYMYILNHKGKFSTSQLMHDEPDLGVCHSDDLRYLFNGAMLGSIEFDESDVKVQRIVSSLWTNFAKTSMPTPNKSPDVNLTWIPMNPGKIRYLQIEENPSIFEGFRADKMKFWSKEVPKHLLSPETKEEL